MLGSSKKQSNYPQPKENINLKSYHGISRGDIYIGNDVWISVNVVVLTGVIIEHLIESQWWNWKLEKILKYYHAFYDDSLSVSDFLNKVTQEESKE